MKMFIMCEFVSKSCKYVNKNQKIVFIVYPTYKYLSLPRYSSHYS